MRNGARRIHFRSGIDLSSCRVQSDRTLTSEIMRLSNVRQFERGGWVLGMLSFFMFTTLPTVLPAFCHCTNANFPVWPHLQLQWKRSNPLFSTRASPMLDIHGRYWYLYLRLEKIWVQYPHVATNYDQVGHFTVQKWTLYKSGSQHPGSSYHTWRADCVPHWQSAGLGLGARAQSVVIFKNVYVYVFILFKFKYFYICSVCVAGKGCKLPFHCAPSVVQWQRNEPWTLNLEVEK